MKSPRGARPPKKPKAPRTASLALGEHHTVEVTTRPDAALLRVRGASGTPGLSLEIVLTPEGPTVRVHAQSVELTAEGTLAARCRTLTLDAVESVDIRAGERVLVEANAVAIEARTGMVKLHANDDVQLLGEQVLLNCERQPELPPWVQCPPPATPPLLVTQTTNGDAALLDAIGARRP